MNLSHSVKKNKFTFTMYYEIEFLQINAQASNANVHEPNRRETSCFKMAATRTIEGVKARSLKPVFYKMVAIYKILYIYLDSVRNLEHFQGF